MKMVRAAAVIAVVTTAVSQARDYAREHPDEAAVTIDKVEEFVRRKAAPKHGAVHRQGELRPCAGASGCPRRRAPQRATSATARTPGLTDPDPDTTGTACRRTAFATRSRPTRRRAPATTRSRCARTTTRHR